MFAPRSPVALTFALVLSSLSLAACKRDGGPPLTPPATSPPPTSVPDAARPDGAPNASGVPYMTTPPADVSRPPADAEHEPSGVARKIVTRGKGTTHPAHDSFVDLRYAGWERNGHQFEGTAEGVGPRRFDMNELTPGLVAELEQMVEGDRRRIWVPAALAYAKRTDFANAPKGDMTYEVELARIVPRPPVPTDVATPPKGATTTKSGLVYTVLTKGKGKAHPVDETRADVVYTGWTPQGRMFQTSLISGDVVSVRVRLLPPGWREAMQKMVEGDKWRLWLTGKLGFGELPPGQENLPFGPPAGPVVFDVELVRIIE